MIVNQCTYGYMYLSKYSVGKGNLDFDKKYAFIKNPQFLPNKYGTSSK